MESGKNMNFEDTIGEKLRKIRREKHLSQEEVAFESGISTRQYCDIENGLCDTKLGTLRKIADGLGIEMHILF